jgi:hypothetical protein
LRASPGYIARPLLPLTPQKRLVLKQVVGALLFLALDLNFNHAAFELSIFLMLFLLLKISLFTSHLPLTSSLSPTLL